MSLALWLYRIYFDGHDGAVMRRGTRTILVEPPEIPGLGAIEGIDYIPQVVAMIKRTREGWHEMDSAEVRCCFDYLRSDDAQGH